METTQGGRGCELLQLLIDCHKGMKIVDSDATNEDIKTISNEGGVEVSQCSCHKVVQGQKPDRSI